MSYLDDPRVYFAAERTLLAWQRTAIALIGLGFVIERFGLFVRLVSASAPQLTADSRPSLVFGVLLLLLGGLIASTSALQFRRFVRELSAPEIPRGHATSFGPFINFALTAIAVALTAWFVASH